MTSGDSLVQNELFQGLDGVAKENDETFGNTSSVVAFIRTLKDALRKERKV